MPDPIGQCTFLNDVTVEELTDTMTLHKKLCLEFDRGGDGVDMWAPTDVAVARV